MKTCTKCNATFDESNFFRDSSKKDGLRPDCKPCYAALSGKKHGVGRLKILMVGQVFGRLTIDSAPVVDHKHVSRYLCKCSCGKQGMFRRDHLCSGASRSCGCLRAEKTSETKSTHRASNSSLFKRWARIKQRCLNKNDKFFHRYGGRGIKICAEWINNSSAFIEWAILNGYSEELEIDRIDNDGDYSPENCRWVTHEENCRNRVFYKHRAELI